MKEEIRKDLIEAYFAAERSDSLATALETSKKLFERHYPQDITWATLHANALRRIGRPLAAVRIILDLLPQISEIPSQTAIVLGQSYNAMGNKSESERWYNEAAKIAPLDTRPWIYLSVFLMSIEKWKSAFDALSRGLKCSGDVDEVLLNLGDWHRAHLNFELALDCYKKAVALTPDYPVAEKRIRDITNALEMREVNRD